MKITLKLWTEADLLNLIRYGDNKNIWDNMADGFPHPYTREAGLKYLERARADTPAKMLAICSDDEVVGSIGVFPDSDVYRKNAAIAYWIAEPFWGKGIGAEAIRLISCYAFEHFAVERLYAKPYARNIGSHRALEKAGFRLEARLKNAVFKNGEYEDELIYSKWKDDAGKKQDHIRLMETILYVSDQPTSAVFYEKVLRKLPDLNVPGMTEFALSDTCKLGLMPNNGIAKILAGQMPHPESGKGIPRCELYLHVDNVELEYQNTLQAGARLISAPADRDWGHRVCYFSDPDGHVIAFAEKI